MKILRNHFHNNHIITLAFVMCAVLLPPAQASVKTADIPKPLSEALSVYKKGGMQGFITTLLSGSPLEGNQEMRMQVSVLKKIEKFYGAYQSFDILQINTLSDSTRLIYFLLNYEKGPVFGKLTAYKNGNHETITSFQFHTKAEKIFPNALLIAH